MWLVAGSLRRPRQQRTCAASSPIPFWPDGLMSRKIRVNGGRASGHHAPIGPWNTQTFIAALRHDRLDAPWLIGGAMYKEFFDLYVETQLAATLHRGDVVILGNLAIHRRPNAAKALRAIGVWFMFPPPTPPTSTPSRWQSPGSAPCVAPPEPMTNSGKRSATSLSFSGTKNTTTSSKPQDMKPIERNTL